MHISLIGACVQEPADHTNLMRSKQPVDRRWMDLLITMLMERWLSIPTSSDVKLEAESGFRCNLNRGIILGVKV